MSKHLMLIPSLDCQAQCAYCFGPNRGAIMQQDVLTSALDWISTYVSPQDKLEITFHGGEPLLAGKEWYKKCLPMLSQRFEGRLKLGIQSNLWLLDDDYSKLFREYDVSIGTSLDGSERINDTQRGKGYFHRTMAGIETARRNGMNPSVICTLTRFSAPYYQEIFEFFASQALSFSVHEAVCSLGNGHNNSLTLSPEEAAGWMINLFDYYLINISRAQIPTFDSMARGLAAQKGAICTFGECLGNYLTIGPSGEIYACNRFAHHPEWQIGAVRDHPNQETLANSPVWQKLRQRELSVHEDCGECPHFNYCKGGCPYNAFTSGVDQRDPNCQVYRRLFDHISDRALEEVFSDQNMKVVIQQGANKNGLIQKGRLLQIMKRGPHPYKMARKAREIVAAVALACSSSPEEAVDKLDLAGVVTRPELALGSVRALRERLNQQPQQGLVNAYLHVTYACNLSCTHCYAQAGPNKSAVMPVDDVKRLAHETSSAGFRKIIITGGEPLVHPQRDALLASLANLRAEVKPTQIILRTNLACLLTTNLAVTLTKAIDQIVVSVDGDEACHDNHRGSGSYALTTKNLHLILKTVPSSKVLLTAVLTADQIKGSPGKSVQELGEALGVKVRFKSILPIGRGRELNPTPEYYNSLDDHAEILSAHSRPTVTCGLGMNIYIDPYGECYPCYALMGTTHNLGNVLNDGLNMVLNKNDYYRKVTVDSNEQCRSCTLRYLCGGFCRAWSKNSSPDAAPQDCKALQARASAILLGALDTLEISTQRWQSTGLPLQATYKYK